jgi:hypothetical protein
MTATLVLNVDMGSYSPMFGSAQRLSNGDYSFLSGGQGTAPKPFGQLLEVRPDGSTAYVLADNKWVYRSFRVQTLYEGVSDQPAGGTAGSAALVGGTTRSDLVMELPPPFQGLNVAAPRFEPPDPSQVVSPTFALSFGGAGRETLPASAGLVQAEGQFPPNPISPVFFGLANRRRTTYARPSQDAADQAFAALGDGTDDAPWTF